MIGVKQLLIILTGAILFLAGLWFFTREGKEDIGIGNSNEKSIFRDMNDQIVKFGETEYNEDQLAKIKTDITAAEMADQLDPREVKSLNDILNNSLTKSLNLSFSNIFPSSCFESNELTKIVRLLENQKPKNGSEADVNIQKYYNVKKFKSLGTKLDSWMRMKYSLAFEDEVDRIYNLNGVSSCNGCRSLKVKLISRLDDLKRMDVRYADQAKSGRFRCTTFEESSYYYQLLIGKGECP